MTKDKLKSKILLEKNNQVYKCRDCLFEIQHSVEGLRFMWYVSAFS